MTSPLATLIESGTILWLDSVDPDHIEASKAHGATGATSNPIIISGVINSGRYDSELVRLLRDEGLSTSEAAWALTDKIVAAAQQEFLPVWEATKGDDGYVSFEVDPLLEDPDNGLSRQQRVAQYLELGTKWSEGHKNRLIKVPATPAGLEAVEELAARGVPLNVTLIFTMRQYQEARDAVWRGAQRLDSLDKFKSVYSIFVSRVDAYTLKQVPSLSDAAQGEVGIVNAKQVWKDNQDFWKDHPTPLGQQIVFASTGTKNPDDPPWKYLAALAGSDIQTNPPAMNEAVEQSGQTFSREVDKLPPAEVLAEIAAKVDMQAVEDFLMTDGIKKFADPQKKLLATIESKRANLS
ncbi:MAG: transaldolase [Planctomycetes bacterium]|nr:transaldolase [Planctomycetota bacterium]